MERFSEFTGIGINPFEAISEGTLLATVRPQKAEDVVERIGKAGIDVEIIGEVHSGRGEVTVIEEDGSKKTLEYPEQDPFWLAFYKTLEILQEKKA